MRQRALVTVSGGERWVEQQPVSPPAALRPAVESGCRRRGDVGHRGGHAMCGLGRRPETRWRRRPTRRYDGRACNYCQIRCRRSVAYTVGGFNRTPADTEPRSAPRQRGPGKNRSHRRQRAFNNRLSNYSERLCMLLAIRTDVSVSVGCRSCRHRRVW
jgi:hypothetical protein